MKKIVPAINSVFLDIRLLFYILISPLAVVLAYILANVLPGELSQPSGPAYAKPSNSGDNSSDNNFLRRFI